MKKYFFLMVVIMILLVGLGLTTVSAADEEALGRQAEQEGRLRQALTHYVAALQSVSEGGSVDQRLREKIIKLAQQIQPPPAVPEEAERYMARGRAAVKSATSAKDFAEAANEFSKALRIAPWLAEGYYNLGVVQDKAGRYQDAIRNIKLYLVAAPNAPDAKDVRALMFEIEYRQEKAQKEAQEKAEEARRQEAARIERERREAAERATPTLPTTGRWWNSCLGTGSVIPSNPVEIAVKNSQEFWYRPYDYLEGWRNSWTVFQYDSSSRSFINRIFIHYGRPGPSSSDIRIKVISSDYLVWEYADGRKCELRPQR